MLLLLPPELIKVVLFHYACPTLVGRPVSLEPVQLVCKRLNDLVVGSNDLYELVFSAKFSSRFAQDLAGLTSPNWRFQLDYYNQALALVQLRAFPPDPVELQQLLWAVYVMCLEDDDGLNRAQLDSVHAYDWIKSYVMNHLYDGSNENNGWPLESDENALALWIMWYLTTKDRIMSEPEEESDIIVSLVLPYVIGHFRYTTAWAPPNHLHLPLPKRIQLPGNQSAPTTLLISWPTPHGPHPIYKKSRPWNHCLFEHRVALAPPLLTLAAKQHFFIRREIYQFGMPPTMPRTRAEAPERPLPFPTQEDIIEFNSHRLGGFDGLQGGTKIGCRLARAEWRRMQYCANPWSGSRVSNIYIPGSLSGLFVGRMLMMNEFALAGLLANAALPAGLSEMLLSMTVTPVYMRLEELVCRHGEDVLPSTRLRPPPPESPLSEDSDSDSEDVPMPLQEELDHALAQAFDDGMANAFLPPQTSFHNRGEDVGISAPGLDRTYDYHRLVEPSLVHDPEACPGCIRREEKMREIWQQDIENEATRQVLPPCTGVQDVVIRGDTDLKHTRAWGAFTIAGRVRQWDGLIVLMRRSTLATTIFYGYITNDGMSFSGNWRIGTGDPGMPALEGAFSLGKVAE
ncbi:hypothetical protein CYLTODRAFT_445005 [Cylindrobasidium torrendii FP15055 ss-10]|uniref:F-box domain-containing protein n=1 Tax=Cylindrobasidium torrendii FP15055 ss-10 TaxID=1314674 RepID=A0A0D7B5V0_9AGAR|nr:hypothetical protein CYLTODRAFT_445005 [Cylindrobasidium torrendii FP15055 ss-10]